ncbi:hypothetical protein WH47_12105 [Habropoda laboriosa]|uniref:Uncharacterized protein n=1 Tax=Habropoda laboriosa TaxID=597456 RepID=A0A0L7R1H2_9HYME|nr:hypothetical protein WH47_12105 [Habropoda laboriosa]
MLRPKRCPLTNIGLRSSVAPRLIKDWSSDGEPMTHVSKVTRQDILGDTHRLESPHSRNRADHK